MVCSDFKKTSHISPNRIQGIESYFSTLFRPRQDAKSVIADLDEHAAKDQPQLVTVKRINSTYKQSSSNNSNSSLQDDQMIASSPPSSLSTSVDKRDSQSSLHTPSTLSHFSNIFKVNYFHRYMTIELIIRSSCSQRKNEPAVIAERI